MGFPLLSVGIEEVVVVVVVATGVEKNIFRIEFFLCIVDGVRDNSI